MIIIRTIHDLRWLEQEQKLPKWYLAHLRDFFLLLFTASNQEENLDAFILDGMAELVVLESTDQPQGLCLPMVPGSPGLLQMEPEAVGKLIVEGHEIYRVMFMPDNERMIFVFILAGEFPGDVEEWLQEKLAWSEYFAGH